MGKEKWTKEEIKIPIAPRGGVFLMFQIPVIVHAIATQPSQAMGYLKQIKIPIGAELRGIAPKLYK